MVKLCFLRRAVGLTFLSPPASKFSLTVCRDRGESEGKTLFFCGEPPTMPPSAFVRPRRPPCHAILLHRLSEQGGEGKLGFCCVPFVFLSSHCPSVPPCHAIFPPAARTGEGEQGDSCCLLFGTLCVSFVFVRPCRAAMPRNSPARRLDRGGIKVKFCFLRRVVCLPFQPLSVHAASPVMPRNSPAPPTARTGGEQGDSCCLLLSPFCVLSALARPALPRRAATPRNSPARRSDRGSEGKLGFCDEPTTMTRLPLSVRRYRGRTMVKLCFFATCRLSSFSATSRPCRPPHVKAAPPRLYLFVREGLRPHFRRKPMFFGRIFGNMRTY